MSTRRPRHHALAALAAAALLIALAAGCSSENSGVTARPAANDGDATQTAEKPAVTKGAETRRASASSTKRGDQSARPATDAVRRSNRVLLVDKGCVQMNPQSVSIEVGESIEWHSSLDKPVTIHVNGSAFERAEFVVRPGATVRSGPARTRGTFSIWSEPAACQGMARGVHGSGPSVTVADGAPE